MGRAQKLKQQRKEEQEKLKKEERKQKWRTFLIVSTSILVVAVTVFLIFLVNYMKEEETERENEPKVTKEFVLETTKGEIVIGLFGEDTLLAVQHITDLVGQGFYDNLRWYRVENFVVQTGSHYQSLVAESEGAEPDQAKLEEALAKDGEAGVLSDDQNMLPNVRGAVGMAKQSDPQTQQPIPGSARTDFYILKTDAPVLDGDYVIFGKVLEGMEVVDSLETTDVLVKATIREK